MPFSLTCGLLDPTSHSHCNISKLLRNSINPLVGRLLISGIENVRFSMSNPKTLSKLRKCGKLETFSTARHSLGFYNNVGFTATYTLPDNELSVNLKIIYRALGQLIDQHPILSAIPLDEDTKTPYFARLDSIDLAQCVFIVHRELAVPADGQTDEELDAVLEEQHNTNFKEDLGSRPFWRIVMLLPISKSDLEITVSWIYHHALADGGSGAVFHRSLQNALRQATQLYSQDVGKIMDTDTVIQSPSDPLLPPLEDLHPLPLSAGYIVKQLWNDWFPSHAQGLWTGNPVPSEPSRMRFKSLVLSRDATSALVQASRTRGVSLQATLQCILASATFMHLDNEWHTLRASGPISLRRYLKIPSTQRSIDEQLGTWVGQYEFDHRRQPTFASDSNNSYFDWAEALAVKSAIAAELAKDLKDTTVNLLRWVSDVTKFFTKKAGSKRGESFELSNVGVMKANIDDIGEGSSNDNWNIGRCVFSQSASVTGPAFCVSVATGGDGCAVLGFSWLEGAHEEGWVEQVMETAGKRIQQLMG